MRMLRLSLLVPLALAFLSPLARAERVQLSAEQKKAEATHVITGRVHAVYSRDRRTKRHGPGTIETHYLLEIAIDWIEKGKGLRKSEYVYARCWHVKRSGLHVTPGPSGHAFIPKEGQSVRAYLVHGAYPATGQTDNGWAVVYPNGLDQIEDVGK